MKSHDTQKIPFNTRWTDWSICC